MGVSRRWVNSPPPPGGFPADPTLTPAEVKQILADTANPMAGRAAYEVGAGHVDAYEAAVVAGQ